LDEVLDLEGLGLPDGVVEDAVDLGRVGQARDLEGFLDRGGLPPVIRTGQPFISSFTLELTNRGGERFP
jgi:hypothetical protein